MKNVLLIMAVALLTACEGTNAFAPVNNGGGNGVVGTSSARVRFFHALLGSDSDLLLTSNGVAVAGPQSFAVSGACGTVASGDNRQLVFGDANATGTAIVDSIGSALTTLAAGGNYTIVAVGTREFPQLLVLDNNAITPPSGNVNVRLVNASLRPIDFFATPTSTLTAPTNANVFGISAGTFATVPAQNTTLTFRNAGSQSTLLTSTASFTAGQSYNVMLVPDELGVDFQSVTTTRC